jgi:hypothetical protein
MRYFIRPRQMLQGCRGPSLGYSWFVPEKRVAINLHFIRCGSTAGGSLELLNKLHMQPDRLHVFSPCVMAIIGIKDKFIHT